MVRAAAKNFPYVACVTHPDQYTELCAELNGELNPDAGEVSGTARARWATAAFQLLSRYDGTVADALASVDTATPNQPVPARLSIDFPPLQTLRYGENPHQSAAFYGPEHLTRTLCVLQGKELSYNNLLDVGAVVTGVREIGASGCVVVKHASPSGIAVAADSADAFRLARDADPLSAFGGIIGQARAMDAETAAEIVGDFYEVVVAPSYSDEARALLATKKNLRVIALGQRALTGDGGRQVRSVLDGYLVQSIDVCAGAVPPAMGSQLDEIGAAEVATERAPSGSERQALALAWKTARLVRSNAVVMTDAQRTLGIGGGQASRIDALEVAALKAVRCGHDLSGSVLASDGFFPFRDCVDRAAQLGVTAIAQPGGSRRDADSIAAANEHGIAMLMTGRRHFLH